MGRGCDRVEFQIIEGGVGDIIPVAGYNDKANSFARR